MTEQHEPWCALVVSVNHGGPIFNKCDCQPPKKREPKAMPLFADTLSVTSPHAKGEA